MQTKEKKYIKYFLLCLLWPLMLITRQLFMSMAVQGILVYFFFNKLKTKNLLLFGVLALSIILLFGIVGDLRSGNSDFFIAVAQPSSNYPTFLPSGFLWVYIYITSPLNNVNFNIHDYPLFNFNPSPLLSSILPSFIRDKISFWGQSSNFKLVDDLLNVSSMFPNYLSAFGYFGSIFFYFIMGLIFNFIYFKTKRKKVNIKWVFILVVILHNILFSLFVDFFSSLVFIFQIVLHYIIGTKFNIKNDKV
jgi:oligosaccharide repeat unit polymerase